MHRHEISREDARRHLAGAIRNMASAPGIVFSPWYGLDLSLRDGVLYRTDASKHHFDRGFTPIGNLDELLAKSDEEIMQVVTGEKCL